MAYNPTNNKHVQRYSKAHYDVLFIRVPKGCKRLIDAAAAAGGVSVNAWINEAVRAALGVPAASWSDVQTNSDSEGAADDCKIQ